MERTSVDRALDLTAKDRQLVAEHGVLELSFKCGATLR
jgi:hypothetical protein